MPILTDNFSMYDAPKRTKEGYLAVRAKSARTGIQDYMGYEVDPEGKRFKATDKVAVYRPESEVMSEKSIRSFVMKPITDDHPAQGVTSDNWSKLSKGVVAGAVRDGEYVAFDLVFMDAATIKKIESGKVELSNGYSTDLSFEDGVTPDGKPYQAIQRSITGNHVALVDKARAGPDCAIGLCDAMTVEIFRTMLGDRSVSGDAKPMKTILIDGHSVEVSDAAEIAIAGLNKRLNDADATVARLTTDKATADTAVATLTTQVATKDAEIATLKKQVEDGRITPAALRDAAAKFAKVVATGKALGVNVTDSMDEAAIMKAVVTAKLGDVAKDWTDAQFATSFATLAAGVKTADTDTMRDGLQTVTDSALITDAKKARDARFAHFENAHLGDSKAN